jgi:hypothetical protein
LCQDAEGKCEIPGAECGITVGKFESSADEADRCAWTIQEEIGELACIRLRTRIRLKRTESYRCAPPRPDGTGGPPRFEAY